MDDAPWNVSEISRLQFEVERRLTTFMLRRIKVLPAQWEFHGCSGDCPVFRPGNLQHEHVVRIVMIFGPLRPRWGQIGVRLEGNAKFAFEAAAKSGKRLDHDVQVLQGY